MTLMAHQNVLMLFLLPQMSQMIDSSSDIVSDHKEETVDFLNGQFHTDRSVVSDKT